MSRVLWTAHDIAAATNGRLAGASFDVTGISTDTRSVARGDLFIALKGPTFDGNQFIEQALERGAAGVLCSVAAPNRAVMVQDTFQALHHMGAAARARAHGRIFAITGSVGKTSAKSMLASVLAAFGSVHAAEASLNNHWGVPLSLVRMPRDVAAGVFEIGMNHAGEISPLSRLVAPHVTLITAIATAHIENLGSIENIARAKAEIFDGLDPVHGIAVLPRDSAQYDILLAEARRKSVAHIVTFGTHDDSDMKLVSFAENDGTSHLHLSWRGVDFSCAMRIPGAHQAMNAAGVLASVAAAGYNPVRASAMLADMMPVVGRGNRFTVAGMVMIDETHNASPVAMEAALSVLGAMSGVTRRVIALGDMLELGAQSPLFHAQLRDAVIKARVDVALLAGPMMVHLAAALPPGMATHYADSAALAAAIPAQLRAGDAVLVKGSRGSKMKRVIDAVNQLGQVGQNPSITG
jgi:UDP-N-acetylmuramoyl-tripeptide--D-alanyl-D-alanine ligase